MNSVIAGQLKEYLAAQKDANAKQDNEQVSENILRESFGLVDTNLDKLILSLDDYEEPQQQLVVHDSEFAELMSLHRAANAARYIQLTADEKPLDGAEAELNAALGMGRPGTLPLGMLLKPEEMHEKEELADAVTNITTETTVNTSPIAPRVFKATAANLMGFQMPTVPSGTQRYPFLTAGGSAAVVAAGQKPDASAVTLDVVEVTPLALQATYILSREMLTIVGNEIQSLMQTDLRMIMGSALDDEILQGDGATPARRKGLFPFIKDVTFSSGDMGTATTWAQAESIASNFVDGRYFMEDTGTRMLIGLSTYRFLRKLYPPSGGGRIEPIRHALAAIRQDGVTIYTRDRTPAALAATNTIGKSQDALYMGGEGPGNVLIPIWNDMDLLIDPYTKGRERQIQMTFFMFFGMAYRRRTLDGSDNTIGSIPGIHKLRWVETDDTAGIESGDGEE